MYYVSAYLILVETMAMMLFVALTLATSVAKKQDVIMVSTHACVWFDKKTTIFAFSSYSAATRSVYVYVYVRKAMTLIRKQVHDAHTIPTHSPPSLGT